MTKKGWKNHFLSSGLPLEFDTAKLLTKNGFAIHGEFPYERVQAGQSKDFSVDLSSSLCFPTSNHNKITAELRLLIECKYRAPNITWIFLPDVNSPEFSLGTAGHTLRAVDEFSFCHLAHDPTYDFERNTFCCYKGTEIDRSSGKAHDSEIKHGISQLQYALPHLISEEILFNVLGHPGNIIPFFLLPLLVTTAEPRVLRENVGLEEVVGSRTLADISQEVPYLVLHRSLALEFVRHSNRQFSELADLNDCENVREIEKRLRATGFTSYGHSSPSLVVKALCEGRIDRLKEFCSQFLVCSFDQLSRVLTLVKELIRSSLRKRKSF